MSRQLCSLCCLTLLVVIAVCPDSSPGQSRAATQRATPPDKILAFLRAMGEASQPKVTFRGEVIPIPEDLRKSLELQFYLHPDAVLPLLSVGHAPNIADVPPPRPFMQQRRGDI